MASDRVLQQAFNVGRVELLRYREGVFSDYHGAAMMEAFPRWTGFCRPYGPRQLTVFVKVKPSQPEIGTLVRVFG